MVDHESIEYEICTLDVNYILYKTAQVGARFVAYFNNIDRVNFVNQELIICFVYEKYVRNRRTKSPFDDLFMK